MLIRQPGTMRQMTDAIPGRPYIGHLRDYLGRIRGKPQPYHNIAVEQIYRGWRRPEFDWSVRTRTEWRYKLFVRPADRAFGGTLLSRDLAWFELYRAPGMLDRAPL